MNQATRRRRPNQASPRGAVGRDPDAIPVRHAFGAEVLLRLATNTAADERRGVVQDDVQDCIRARNVGRGVFVVQAQQSAGLDVRPRIQRWRVDQRDPRN